MVNSFMSSSSLIPEPQFVNAAAVAEGCEHLSQFFVDAADVADVAPVVRSFALSDPVFRKPGGDPLQEVLRDYCSLAVLACGCLCRVLHRCSPCMTINHSCRRTDQVNSAPETRKAAGRLNPAAGSVFMFRSGLDEVGPGFADLIAGDGQAMLLRQRSARAQQGSRGVLLPAHPGHDLFQSRAAFALQHLDHLARLAAFARS